MNSEMAYSVLLSILLAFQFKRIEHWLPPARNNGKELLLHFGHDTVTIEFSLVTSSETTNKLLRLVTKFHFAFPGFPLTRSLLGYMYFCLVLYDVAS